MGAWLMGTSETSTLPSWDLVTLGSPDLCTAATVWMEEQGKGFNRKMHGAQNYQMKAPDTRADRKGMLQLCLEGGQ